MIEQEISAWDGKSTEDINAVYCRNCNEDSFTRQIVEFSSVESLQLGATWLLKRHLENGRDLTEKETTLIFRAMPMLENWEAKLHLLQCLPYLAILKNEKYLVERFLRECLMDANKFVRAWSYSGFYEISVQYPEYQKEAAQLFEMAMKDESASVKARIRNVVKKGLWKPHGYSYDK